VTVNRVDHLGLTVSDMERSLAFWRDLLGCTERGRGVIEWEHLDRLVAIDGTRIEWVELTLPGGGTIELQQYHRPAGTPMPDGGENDPGRSHLALEVSDLDALLGRLNDAGIRTRTAAPVLLEQGAYRGWRAAYALDPDGYGLELMERKTPDHRMR
jgi:catechol 2,3-dioxygenase-like lactoylglutathione lyase family enzyme